MFADVLRQFRKETGLPQEAVAEKLGVSQVTISRYERGDVVPHMKHIKGLCALLEKSAEEMIDILSD